MNNSYNDDRSTMPPPNKVSKADAQKLGLSSSDQLFEQAQSLIAEINAKRKNDTLLLESRCKQTIKLRNRPISTSYELLRGADNLGEGKTMITSF